MMMVKLVFFASWGCAWPQGDYDVNVRLTCNILSRVSNNHFSLQTSDDNYCKCYLLGMSVPFSTILFDRYRSAWHSLRDHCQRLVFVSA
jgi:hypothetical protein